MMKIQVTNLIRVLWFPKKTERAFWVFAFSKETVEGLFSDNQELNSKEAFDISCFFWFQF